MSAYIRNDHPKAMETYRAALTKHRAAGDVVAEAATLNRMNEAWTLVMLGKYLGEAGELSEARARIEEAINLNEALRRQVVSQELRTSFQPLFVNPYQRYIDVLMLSENATPGAGFAAQAFQSSERARARNLLELLVESRADIRAGVDPKLLMTERELQQRRQQSRNSDRFVGGQTYAATDRRPGQRDGRNQRATQRRGSQDSPHQPALCRVDATRAADHCRNSAARAG